MVNQAGGRAFAFRSGNADGLVMELTEKQIGLRSDFHAFRVKVFQGNPRRLDDDVVVVHSLKILFASMFHAFHRVLVGYRHDCIGQVFLQKVPRRFAFATEAEDENAFAAKPIQNKVIHRDVILGFARIGLAGNVGC